MKKRPLQYTIAIIMKDVTPAIRRTIQIPGTLETAKLAACIMLCFTDTVKGGFALEIDGMSCMTMDDGIIGELDASLPLTATLAPVSTGTMTFSLAADRRDDWQVEFNVESMDPRREDQPFATCTDGQGCSPCGHFPNQDGFMKSLEKKAGPKAGCDDDDFMKEEVTFRLRNQETLNVFSYMHMNGLPVSEERLEEDFRETGEELARHILYSPDQYFPSVPCIVEAYDKLRHVYGDEHAFHLIGQAMTILCSDPNLIPVEGEDIPVESAVMPEKILPWSDDDYRKAMTDLLAEVLPGVTLDEPDQKNDAIR